MVSAARHDGAVPFVVRGFVVPDTDLSWRFSRSSGPGGQHVNTTDTRVQLRFDLAGTTAFPESLKQRLLDRLGEEVLVVASERRSQLRNRELAQERLAAILADALRPPPSRRVPTKPSKGSQRRRVDAKKRRGETKRLRGRPQE